jgi:flagellar FliJ protein
MGFRFTLAAVLRLREIREEIEERRLSEILAQIARTRESITVIDAEMVEAAAKRDRDLSGGMSGSELHAANGLAAMLKEHRQLRLAKLAHLEQLRDQQIPVYKRAHQDRELLSGMREEQREEYAAGQLRQQQKLVDDLFTARIRRR